ncbi:hypothetical protein BpHYR1_044994 [Brachionus plicatilis]|uniref:Uncharacterized protein n=1 Tax=Brachionus plicatilis TaxID=10195 RepID=A0A3M7RIS7_BRAPC|nr:hypothetical protein BpHYR1_044994 [Brachionus plicatilis]
MVTNYEPTFTALKSFTLFDLSPMDKLKYYILNKKSAFISHGSYNNLYNFTHGKFDLGQNIIGDDLIPVAYANI